MAAGLPVRAPVPLKNERQAGVMASKQYKRLCLLFFCLGWNRCVVCVASIKAPLSVDPLRQHERRSSCNGLQQNSGGLSIYDRFEVKEFLTQP